MSRPRSDLEALREDLRKVYDGDPWHGASITEVLKGVDADVAALKAELWRPSHHRSVNQSRARPFR